MTHGSLFSGIGGFDLAAQWMGWENVFHCEINPFGQKILKHYWPNAESFNDITKTNFSKYANKIDVLSGGFPCQPFSMAGKRKGTEDSRHLWPEMLRTIREIAPRWVVGENVFGIVSWDGGLVFDQVQIDLESEGYEVTAVVIPAAAKNAPHGRDRVWFVAHNHGNGNVANPDGIRLETWEDTGKMGNGQNKMGSERSKFTYAIETNGNVENVADPNGSRRWESNKTHEGKPSKQFDGNCIQPIDANPNGIGFKRWGDQEIGKTAGRKIVEHGSSTIRSSWENFPSQSPVCGRNDGISTKLDGITFPQWRNESIKGFGNAVVPQVVFEIFKTIELYEQKFG